MNWDFPTAPGGVTAADFSALEARMTAAEADIAALEAVPGATQQIYACLAGDAVRKLVYQSASGTVALADASNPAKMPAIGFIASKPTTTSCVLQDEDELSGFVGLTPDAVYYADPASPGGITTTQPSLPGDAGKVAQQVGVAKSATVLRITIATSPPVYL